MEYYQEAAEQGLAAAQYNLGIMYANGRGVLKDERLAVQWFQKAAEQGDAWAQCCLGVRYTNGRGVAKDERLAVHWYRKAAEQGHADAQCYLGVMYDNGLGVVKDERLAVQWYRKAAEQGLAWAQYNLGIMYENGQGVVKDERLAVQWFRKSAEQGHAAAQFSLGFMYENGQGVVKDEPLAVQWFQKAAEQGDADAQCYLGVMYDNGRGVAKDERLAVQWYRKAAEQGDARAQCGLGFMYENGQGVVKDERLAVQWYRKAAEQGLAWAQYNLGEMYELGRGVAQSYTQALYYHQLAAKQGKASAQYSLGVLYEHGQGVVLDVNQATTYFELAAKQDFILAQYHLSALQGNSDVQYMLGKVYEQGHESNGWITPKKPAFALYYYQLAASQNQASAQAALKRLQPTSAIASPPPSQSTRRSPFRAAEHYQQGKNHYHGKNGPKNRSQAAHHFQQTAQAGLAGAQSYLGYMHTNGQGGLVKDAEKGKRYYQLAAKQGYRKAQTALAKLAAASQPALLSTSSISPSFYSQPSRAQTTPGPAGTSPIHPNSYEIEHQSLTFSGKILGSGGFGVVRQGVWQYQPVAIKQLLVANLTARDEQEFRSEVIVNVGLRHPNVTTFYGACMQSPHYCLVMEYMPKGSLYQLLRNTPLDSISWAQRYTWVRDIGAGLAYLHNQGVIHRDLKSMNVLLDDRLRAKLADFGLSKMKQKSQTCLSVGTVARPLEHRSAIHLAQAGTNRWKSPELFSRRARHTPASDMYAFACVLWEMASHKVPFEDEPTANDGTIAVWVRDGERDDIPEQTPPQYAALITRCWAQRADARPSVAQVMGELTQAVPPDSGLPSRPA